MNGYLLKDESPEDLLQALRTLDEGASWFSKSVAETLKEITQSARTRIRFTAREREVLALIKNGYDNFNIAEKLCLAEQTIRNYSTTIYEKINVSGRVECVIWACDNEW